MLEFGNKYSDNENIHEFLRFSKIRNEFIINHLRIIWILMNWKFYLKNNDNLKWFISLTTVW